MQPGTGDFVYDFHDEKCVLALQIVVFKINDDILFFRLANQFFKRSYGKVHVRRNAIYARHGGSNARRTQNTRNIHPLETVFDGPFAASRIPIVIAIGIIDRNIDHRYAGLLDGFAKFLKVANLGGRKVSGKWLNAGNPELATDACGKIAEIHSRNGIVTAIVGGADNLRAKRPRSNCEAVSWCGWELYVWGDGRS